MAVRGGTERPGDDRDEDRRQPPTRARVALRGARLAGIAVLLAVRAPAATQAAPAGTAAVRAQAVPAAHEVAYVRASHLVPGLGSMVVGIVAGEVRVRGKTGAEAVVSPSLGYGQVTPYAALPPGAYAVTIRDPHRHGRGAPCSPAR